MKFNKLDLDGAILIESEKHNDERGFFARCRCHNEFASHDLPTEFVQSSICMNTIAGTFRGLHMQISPSEEGKLVRCVHGTVLDIVADLRRDSDTFLQHVLVELGADATNAIYIPPGLAHGYLTLTDGATLYYEMTDYYAPELARGIRWNDPALDIRLPGEIRLINDRDATFPDIDVDRIRRDGEAGL